MIVSSFTKPELNILRENCNFVGDEITVFELRSVGVPLAEIAEQLSYIHSGIKNVSRKVNSKIERVLSIYNK